MRWIVRLVNDDGTDVYMAQCPATSTLEAYFEPIVVGNALLHGFEMKPTISFPKSLEDHDDQHS